MGFEVGLTFVVDRIATGFVLLAGIESGLGFNSKLDLDWVSTPNWIWICHPNPSEWYGASPLPSLQSLPTGEMAFLSYNIIEIQRLVEVGVVDVAS